MNLVDQAREQSVEDRLLASIARKIIKNADYLSTEASGAIRIDSWIEGFTPEEVELMRKLHGRVY